MARLIGYQGEPILVRLAGSVEAARQYQENGLDALLIREGIAVLCQDGMTDTSYAVQGEITWTEQDTVFVNGEGFLRLWFPFCEESQTLLITNQCNSNCVMCPYSESFRRRAAHPNELFLLRQIDYLPEHTSHLTITGGEPTLHTEAFFHVMERIRCERPGVHCLLLTNGRSFSLAGICQRAVHTFPQHTVAAVPLHAADAAVHDRITQTSDSFRQTLAGIGHLLSMQLAVEIRIVVMQQNVQEMTALADLIVTRFPTVQVVNFMAAEMCGNAAVHRDAVWIGYPEAFHACREAVARLVEHGVDVGLYNFPLCSIPLQYRGLYRRSISGYKIVYGSICETCQEKNACGGVFASALRYAEHQMQAL